MSEVDSFRFPLDNKYTPEMEGGEEERLRRGGREGEGERV